MTKFDARQYAAATERNRQPILEVLLKILPSPGNILEIASGTGEHAVFFAPHLQPRQWIPSDPNPLLRDSINAWRQNMPSDNLHEALNIDVRNTEWYEEIDKRDIKAIVNINMIHISPWTACLGLMTGASSLPSQGILYLYGPFKQGRKHTAPSNISFDESLRSQNPEWGVRDIEEVIAAATNHGLIFKETIAMPANNLSVIFAKN